MEEYIYFHIAAIGRYQSIVTEMYNTMLESGILDRITEMRYCVTGKKENKDWVVATLAHPRCRLYAYEESTMSYERFTLDLLHRDALAYPGNNEFRVLYLHSKGVTKPHTAGGRAWRNLMMHFLVTHHTYCLDLMQSAPYEAVGVLFRAIPQPHFSGNFWWSTRSYLRTLPPLRSPMVLYIDTELWIGLSLCHAASVFQRKGPLQTEPLTELIPLYPRLTSLVPSVHPVVSKCTQPLRPRLLRVDGVRILHHLGYDAYSIKDHGLLFPLDPESRVRVVHDHVPAVQSFTGKDFETMYPELFIMSLTTTTCPRVA